MQKGGNWKIFPSEIFLARSLPMEWNSRYQILTGFQAQLRFLSQLPSHLFNSTHHPKINSQECLSTTFEVLMILRGTVPSRDKSRLAVTICLMPTGQNTQILHLKPLRICPSSKGMFGQVCLKMLHSAGEGIDNCRFHDLLHNDACPCIRSIEDILCIAVLL